nr:MAG TPA: hypothetical protein [Caudoviricetes sp.]
MTKPTSAPRSWGIFPPRSGWQGGARWRSRWTTTPWFPPGPTPAGP